MNQSNRRVQKISSWGAADRSSWSAFQRVYRLIALPFCIVASAWRLAVAIGVGIVRFSVNLCAAALGVAIVLVVGYALARALLHLLFQAL